jgi:hypothetical protein
MITNVTSNKHSSLASSRFLVSIIRVKPKAFFDLPKPGMPV